MREYTFDKEKMKAMHTVLHLGYQINCETPFAVFMSYYGHTNQFDIRINKSKEGEGMTDPISDTVTLYLDGSLEAPMSRWAKLIANLQIILEKYRTTPTKLDL